MTKMDWSKANVRACDPATVIEADGYEAPQRIRACGPAPMTPADRRALLERSESIRLVEVAKKQKRIADLKSGKVSRWHE